MLSLIKNIICYFLIFIIFFNNIKDYNNKFYHTKNNTSKILKTSNNNLQYPSIFLNTKIHTYTKLLYLQNLSRQKKEEIKQKEEEKSVGCLGDLYPNSKKLGLKHAWEKNKWDAFAVFVYPTLFISTIISIIFIFSPIINTFFLIAISISISIILTTIIWSFIIKYTSLKKSPIARYLPKILVLVISGLAIIIFPANIAPIIIVGYYFTSFCTSFINITTEEKKSKFSGGLMLAAYLFYMISKIVVMSNPLVFTMILLGSSLIFFMLFFAFPKSKAKHVGKLVFYIVNIIFSILGFSGIKINEITEINSARALSSGMATVVDIVNSLEKLANYKKDISMRPPYKIIYSSYEINIKAMRQINFTT